MFRTGKNVNGIDFSSDAKIKLYYLLNNFVDRPFSDHMNVVAENSPVCSPVSQPREIKLCMCVLHKFYFIRSGNVLTKIQSPFLS